MNNEQVILSTLGTFKIKYSVLEDLDVKKADALHIDLNSVLKQLFKLKDLFDTKYSYKFSIASSIINLAAHFKAYFIKRKNNIKIYLYHSNSYHNNKIVEQINDAIDLVSVIVKYIPGVYLITDKKIDIKLTMDYFLSKNKTNYIFTKNHIYYQFISKNTYVLRPSRDDSYVVNKKNLYNKISASNNEYTISNELLTAILSFSGTGEYSGVKGLGIKKVLKKFQKAIDNKLILNEHYSNIANLLMDIGYKDEYEHETICDTYSQIDVYESKKSSTNKHYKELICDQFIIDKFAKKDLQELNIKYFTGFNSLMLQELLLEPKQSNDKNKIDW